MYRCYTTTAFTWLIVQYAYLGVLQIMSIILAVQTRKVNKAIHDSKEVIAIVYITSIIMIILVVSFALGSYQNIGEAIISGCLIFAGLIVLILIFIPKVTPTVHVLTNLFNIESHSLVVNNC